ncbi:hypothetical protein [Nonomuraea endophytica]|uniref:hypothetical protein n=1 Tax=Nonomuraea endophytica TaxID=714136 RepID=UPI0037C982D2
MTISERHVYIGAYLFLEATDPAPAHHPERHMIGRPFKTRRTERHRRAPTSPQARAPAGD